MLLRFGRIRPLRAPLVAADPTDRVSAEFRPEITGFAVNTIIRLKLARESKDRDPSDAWELVEEALRQAERANNELRDVVHGVLPAALSAAGLRTGIESFAADMDLPVVLDVTPARLSADLETTAYFIVAEALTNVVKHARASQALVSVAVDGRMLNVTVRDDGIGGADIGTGNGVIGMRDRAEAAGGTFELRTGDGGTQVHVELPIPARPRDASEPTSQ